MKVAAPRQPPPSRSGYASITGTTHASVKNDAVFRHRADLRLLWSERVERM
jgi:hypothetical protein